VVQNKNDPVADNHRDVERVSFSSVIEDVLVGGIRQHGFIHPTELVHMVEPYRSTIFLLPRLERQFHL
jgi:hypothetical protein